MALENWCDTCRNFIPEARGPEEMTDIGNLFAIRIKPEGGLVELYVEDDGIYHLKATFNHLWLSDLSAVAKRVSHMVPIASHNSEVGK